MSYIHARRPIANFFVKKRIQIRFIFWVVGLVILSTAITTALLCFIYFRNYQDGTFYYMSNDIREDIELTSILGIVVPSVMVVNIVSISIGLLVGLFSSRKIAVPIYKFEKWVNELKAGRLNVQMAFREQGQMEDLAYACNSMADVYRRSLLEIQGELEQVSQELSSYPAAQERVKGIRAVLDRFVLS